MKRKYILILGKGWTDGLDDTQITAEAEYSINISEWTEKFCLGLHCNESNSFNVISHVSVDANLMWENVT